MPINARGRSTKQGSRPPFRHVEWSPPLKKSIKVTQDTSYPMPPRTQVTNRSLAAHSPEYSVPLTAAVTYVYYIMTTRCKSLQISDNHCSLTNISAWFLAGTTVYKIPMRVDIKSASQNIKILKTFSTKNFNNKNLSIPQNDAYSKVINFV